MSTTCSHLIWSKSQLSRSFTTDWFVFVQQCDGVSCSGSGECLSREISSSFAAKHLSPYIFLTGLQMEILGEKLLKELPEGALVVACRFPFSDWPQKSCVGSGLDQTFAYDISSVRTHLRTAAKWVRSVVRTVILAALFSFCPGRKWFNDRIV